MAHCVTPHTVEWFSLLEKFDPVQAEQTRAIIKKAGTDKCCSVCGDTEPIADYYLVQQGAQDHR